MKNGLTIAPLKNINNGIEIVDYFLQNKISVHSFFKDDKRFNLAYINLILENGRELDITGFLARTISMTSNLDIRCSLVPQLYDELGGGDPKKLHITHIANLLNAIKPYVKIKSQADKIKLEEAYGKVGKVYQNLFFSDSFNTCIGVAIANEIIVQPIFEYIKENVQINSGKLKKEDIIWVTAHDELEEDHVGDTKHLSSVISQSPKDLKEVFDSGFALFLSFWEFFDVLHSIELEE